MLGVVVLFMGPLVRLTLLRNTPYALHTAISAQRAHAPLSSALHTAIPNG
jgi:hypothetical protein